MTIDDPWYLERDRLTSRNAVQRRSPSSGHASPLPMSEEQKSEAAEREKTKVVGFAPPKPKRKRKR